jgi:hypothetical protein
MVSAAQLLDPFHRENTVEDQEGSCIGTRSGVCENIHARPGSSRVRKARVIVWSECRIPWCAQLEFLLSMIMRPFAAAGERCCHPPAGLSLEKPAMD